MLPFSTIIISPITKVDSTINILLVVMFGSNVSFKGVVVEPKGIRNKLIIAPNDKVAKLFIPYMKIALALTFKFDARAAGDVLIVALSPTKEVEVVVTNLFVPQTLTKALVSP